MWQQSTCDCLTASIYQLNDRTGPIVSLSPLATGIDQTVASWLFWPGCHLSATAQGDICKKGHYLHHQQWKCCYRLVKAYIVMACLQTMVAQEEPSVSVLQPAPAGILHWVDQNHNYNWHYTVKTSQCIAHGHYMVIKVPVSLLLVAVKWSQT